MLNFDVRISSLDGLRAISIAFVIIGHAAECGLAPRFFELYANFGVQVFFVISGFLITSLLLKERERLGTINLKAFYIRRVLRIFPAAYFFIFVMFAIYPMHLWDRFTSLAYLSNFNASRPWVVGHLWSLSVEEQFYLIWPATFSLFFAKNRAILFMAVAMAPLTNLILHFAHLSAYIGSAFPSVADSLALGCLGAIIGSSKFSNNRFALAAPVAMLLQAIPVPASVRVLIFWPLMHVLIAAFVLHAVEAKYAWLNTKALSWVGLLSYSLYLWQQPLLNSEHPSMMKMLLIFPCAVASYFLIERPFLKLKDSLVMKPALQGAKI